MTTPLIITRYFNHASPDGIEVTVINMAAVKPNITRATPVNFAVLPQPSAPSSEGLFTEGYTAAFIRVIDPFVFELFSIPALVQVIQSLPAMVDYQNNLTTKRPKGAPSRYILLLFPS